MRSTGNVGREGYQALPPEIDENYGAEAFEVGEESEDEEEALGRKSDERGGKGNGQRG